MVVRRFCSLEGAGVTGRDETVERSNVDTSSVTPGSSDFTK